MQTLRSLLFVFAAFAPVASYAFTDADSRLNDIIKQHQAAVQVYADKRNKPMPQTIDYKYGMKLDIATVVRQSSELKTCKVTPKLMTYEDSKGELNTIRYLTAGECRNKY